MPELTKTALSIFQEALERCSIAAAFDRSLKLMGTAGSERLVIRGGDEFVDFSQLSRLRVVSIGKAASPMLDSLLRFLPPSHNYDLKTILIAPTAPSVLREHTAFFAGGHPLPNQESLRGAATILSMLHSIANRSHEDTLCIFLISGGASAMMELPLDPSISLQDTVAFHEALVASGANIVEMNCVRKHFSAVKGGRLVAAAGGCRTLSLLLSDVPAGHLDALASGPTLPDSTTIAQCKEIIERYHLDERFTPAVRRFFASTALKETPKEPFLHSSAWKLLDSEDLAFAAKQLAESLGYYSVVDNSCDDWPYDRAVEYLLNRIRKLRQGHSKVCLISSGEISVLLRAGATSGRGGRNQQFALYAATQLRPEDRPLAILSAGSDGIDGNSDAAGAVISCETLTTAADRVSACESLERFDSFTWLNSAGATIFTGRTAHNLRDLRILLSDIYASSE